MMHTVLIASPDDIRVKQFQASLLELNHPIAEVISYQDIISGLKHLKKFVRDGSVVRIESLGKDREANRQLLNLGENQDDGAGNYARLSQHAIVEQIDDKGLILVPRQWYLGLREFLRMIQEQLAECPSHHLMNHPDDIILMFDKCLCHDYLESNHINVPEHLAAIQSFDDLNHAMHHHNMRRVFIKLAHGSSASGVIAFQTNGSEYRATAAIEMVREKSEFKLYNTRRIRTYDDVSEIETLVDTLCRHRVHVQQWIPKASMEGKAFDLRVLVVDGKAAHTVARLSNSPMTNLHLLNERRHREEVIEHLGLTTFKQVMALCEEAMTCFSKSLYAGIDVVVASGQKQHYIVEMNAFGDLLNNTYFHGLSTYALEIQRMAQYEHA